MYDLPRDREWKMNLRGPRVLLPLTLALGSVLAPAAEAAAPAGLSGDLMQWHKVTVTLDGPFARERDTSPNPVLDYRLTVRFAHESGTPVYDVPGYFAADGNAGETSAEEGAKWRVHLSPDKTGRWTWRASMVRGPRVAVDSGARGEPVAGVDGASGSFEVLPTDKTGRDFRARGRLQYVGGPYLRFAGTGEYFLKAGADAPETLLGYADFDGTVARRPAVPLKTWAPHVRDWRPGDPTWKGGRGKGLVGALDYLAGRGANAFSFLTYNAGGDGDNVWPFVERDLKLHYDCSKLDQWQVVFDHAQSLGLYLHFKTQETEIDDQRFEHQREARVIPEALDGGAVSVERRLYYRELVARFGHELALNWNLGEENTQTPDEQRAMAQAFSELDPYHHLVVIHTYPDEQDRVYTPLLGEGSNIAGASLQNHWDVAHQRVLKWRRESAKAGKPWVVANDEQGDAALGVPPDPGFEGFSGRAKEKGSSPPGVGEPSREGREYDLHDVRRYTLWGTLMAGGAGVEYYFGYSLPQNDLRCEDWRSRERSWDFAAIALEFFRRERIPLPEMEPADALVGNPAEDNTRYALAKRGEVYLVYLPRGGTADLDLSGATGRFAVSWLDPRRGGPLQAGSVREIDGGGKVGLGTPPADANDDWLAVVRARATPPDPLAAILGAHPEWFGEVLSRESEHRLQILYTQIDRDPENRPVFRSFSRGLTDEYFYPASTVKLPAAVLALEKLNDLAVPGLSRDTPLRIEAGTAAQTSVERDPSKADGLPTIAQYIKKVFLVSDNDAFNRLYEFLGQKEINERLWKRGFTDARILRRLEATLDPEENRVTNPFVFFQGDRVLLRQPLARNPEEWTNERRGVRQGRGYLRDGQLVEQPFDFSHSSYLSVRSLQGILKSVLFPDAVSPGERFRLTEDDYRFLYAYMSMLPRESAEPSYPDREEHYDSYVKFFLFGDSKAPLLSAIRIFNKVGDAYGYLIDDAYVVDFDAGVEFLLTAVIQVNANQIYNDDTYEYDEVGMPFLARLGRAVYEHERARERPRRPDLSRFRVHRGVPGEASGKGGDS
jgi:hypothetical protein